MFAYAIGALTIAFLALLAFAAVTVWRVPDPHHRQILSLLQMLESEEHDAEATALAGSGAHPHPDFTKSA